MLVKDVLPAGSVKELSTEVGIEQFFCFVDFFLSHNGTDQILLEPVLQTKEARMKVNRSGT